MPQARSAIAPKAGSPYAAPMRATLVGLLAVLLWSSLALLTAATGSVPPFQLAGVTFAIGGALGFIIALARGKLSALRQPAAVWIVGVGGLFGYHALYFAALRRAPPAQAGLIAYLWPLLIVLLSATLPGEGRLTGRHVAGALMGLAGVATLILFKDGAHDVFAARYATGYGLAAACAIVWSSYSVLSRRFREVPTDAVAGFCLITAALAGAAHAVFETTVVPISAREWIAMVALGIGPVGAAFYAWDYGVKHGDIKLLGIASYAAPVLSTLILVVCDVTPATSSLALACALIVGGATVASLGGRPRSNAPRRERARPQALQTETPPGGGGV
jgi:drug/metabolite transporter (DMT)-like permease